MGSYGTRIAVALVMVIMIGYAVAARFAIENPATAQTVEDCYAYAREVRAVPATGAGMDKMSDFGCAYGPTDTWRVI